MPKSISRAIARSVSVCALVCSAALLISTPTFAVEVKVNFDIPAENTAKALNDFSAQSGIQIFFPYDAAAQTNAPAVRGRLEAHEALARLLSNSHLEVASETENTVTLRIAKTSAPITAAEQSTEVVVTGSHIRGGNSTSPVHTLTRKDIDQSGYSQVGDLIRSLPENFSGGQNPGVIGAGVGNSDNGNVSSASTVNLRGLGTDATLVLVNGHRLSGDSFRQGSDISGIPLAAINRVEIVPDGASALYGSDAVAGVVNFVLRKNYQGGEVSARIGTTAEGGGTEKIVSLLTGATGNRWYALANIERSTQDAITANDRAFTASAPPEETLVPEMSRTSLFVSGGWTVNERLSLSAEALISDRQSEMLLQASATSTQYIETVRTPAYSASASADLFLAGDWQLHVIGVSSSSRNSDLSYAYGGYSTMHYRNSMNYVEATANGTLLQLDGRAIKVAFGLGQRNEGFVNGDSGGFDYHEDSRRVDYLFAEASVPLVSPASERVGLHELELSLSGRSEHYSEFGTSTTPRVGFRYVPASGLTIRGSWGKSFKAPLFVQLYSAQIVYVFDAQDIGGTSGQSLDVEGGNPNLKPERSTAWTLGLEYNPAFAPSTKVGVTYFNVDYTDRVVSPISNLSDALSDAIYAPFIEPAPSGAEQAQLIDNAYYVLDFTRAGYDPTAVSSVLQNTYSNASKQAVHGFDASYRQAISVSFARLTTFANATWLALDQQTLPTLPSAELSGNVFYVPKFKARVGLTTERGPWSVNGIVNFVSSEKDAATTPASDVASWTTVDANVIYTFADSAHLGKGLRFTVSAINLFDKDPPRTISPVRYTGLNYDSTNASIIGRFVSLTLAKAW